MSLSGLLDQQCDILEQAEAKVGKLGGVNREPPTLVQAGVWCLVRPIGADNSPRQGKATLAISHRIYFDQDYGITTKHRLRVFDGRIFSVTGPTNFNSLGRLIGVDCLEIVE